VILLADHDKEGSVGFIINKPLKYTIHDLIPEINANSKYLTEAQSNRTTSTSSIISQI
jgi:putative AlgH/UPF0301 family transcriptional regulator